MIHTLKPRQQIQEVFKKGKRYILFPFSIVCMPNSLQFNRYVYCADKGSKKAVIRNKVKRVLRALVSEIPLPKQGFDIAIVAKSVMVSMPHFERKVLLSKILSKINE